MVLLKSGKTEDARVRLETALKSDIEFTGRSDAEAKLKSLKSSS
jgi:hypothetical protein